jgi:hypothetical protein
MIYTHVLNRPGNYSTRTPLTAGSRLLALEMIPAQFLRHANEPIPIPLVNRGIGCYLRFMNFES